MADESFHRAMLSRSIELSKKAIENPAIYQPFGAIIVRISDLTVIGEGCNNTREEMDPTLHGEMVAIKAACKKVRSLTLPGCILYSSCEPCSMCAAAIWWAGIEHVYFANKASDILDLLDMQPLYHQMTLPSIERSNYSQMMGKEAETVIRDWNKVKPPAP